MLNWQHELGKFSCFKWIGNFFLLARITSATNTNFYLGFGEVRSVEEAFGFLEGTTRNTRHIEVSERRSMMMMMMMMTRMMMTRTTTTMKVQLLQQLTSRKAPKNASAIVETTANALILPPNAG